MLCVLIRIASSRRFQWVYSTYHYFIEDGKDIPRLFSFVFWPWLTRSGSNYPCLEQISMVRKMFEPLKVDCIWQNGMVSGYLGRIVVKVVSLLTIPWRFPTVGIQRWNNFDSLTVCQHCVPHTQRWNNVDSTSRRLFNVVCPQGPPLQLFFLYASVVLYMAFVLSLFFQYLSFFLCLGRAVLRECGISWIASHIFSHCYMQTLNPIYF